MAFPDFVKVRIRDHLNYGIAGLYRISPAGGTVGSGMIGYRFFQAEGTLEYRMNNMSASEEAMVTGNAMGAVGFTGPNPAENDTFTITVSGGGLSVPVALKVTAGANMQPASIAYAVAAAANANPVLQQAGFYASAAYGSGPFAPDTTIPLPECSIVAPNPFILTASTTSACGATVTMQGNRNAYQASLDGRNTIYGYLPILDGLKGAIASASQNFDTKQADVWKSRASELAMRTGAYEQWRIMFGDFMGLQLKPDAPNRSRPRGYVRYL